LAVVGRRKLPQLVERLLAVQNEALASLPRSLVERLVTDLTRLVAPLETS
jgi:hypothetical protein